MKKEEKKSLKIGAAGFNSTCSKANGFSSIKPGGDLRIIPGTWIEPLDLDAIFDCPVRRLEVDLGCGKGRFLLARAASNPGISFLGLDRQARRLAKLERRALKAGIENIRLLCAEAAYAVEKLLPESSVSAFYAFFPDPWPKRRHQKRRLFSDSFVDALHKTLAADGSIHLATDHADCFASIRRLFDADRRFSEISPLPITENERTDFELIFLGQGKPVHRFSLSKSQSR